VPEGEDVPHRTRAAEDVRHPLVDLLRRKEERQRIEVALERHVRPDECAGLVDLDAPVAPDDVRARPAQQRQVRRHGGSEDDDRNPLRLQRLHHPRQVREGEGLEVARAQLAAPAVEDLHDARARLHLHLEVGDQGARQPLEERVSDLRLLEQEPLDEDEALRAATFHHVRREGEGRAREADDRHRVVQCGPRPPDRLGHEPRALYRIRNRELLHVRCRPQR